MQRLTLRDTLLFCSPALLFFGLTAAAAQDGGEDQLRPVLPTASAEATPPAATAPAAAFDPSAWRERLAAPDLDERERHLDALIGEALRDPAARAWLDETATGGDALAWTARLARRELALRERAQVDPIWGRRPLGGSLDPWAGRSPFEVFDQLQTELDALLPKGFGALPGGDLPNGVLPPGGAPLGAGPSGSGARQQGFSFRLTPEGVRVEVTENVDGEETRKTYEADSLEALLEQNPELREHLDGSTGTLPGFGFEGLPRAGALRIPGLAPRAPVAPPAATDAEPLRTDILGVLVTAVEADEPGPRGLRVHDTVPGTIAHLLGIGRGDLLIELNGAPLRAVEDISRVMSARGESGEVRLRVVDSRGVERSCVWRPVGD